MSTAIQPRFIAQKEISSTIKKLITDHGAETFIGSMVTTQGVYVVLFSHRLNKEFSLIVPGVDMPAVLAKVYEALVP